MKAHGWTATILLLLVPVVLASDPIQVGTSKETITLRVVDRASGVALIGVTVHVDPKYPDWDDPPMAQEAVTGKGGRVSVTLTKRSLTKWLFRKKGYLVAILDGRNVKDGTTVRLKAAMPLTGRVVRFGDGKAIANARVHQWIEGRDIEMIDRTLETDADGRFEVPGLPSRKVVMFGVAADGYASVIARCPPDRREGPFTIVLGEGGTVAGKVLDGEGRPAVGADVCVAEQGGEDPLRKPKPLDHHATSGPDGSFTIVGLTVPGDYVVYSRSKGGSEGTSDPIALREPARRVETKVAVRFLGEITVRAFDAATEKEIDPLDFSGTIDGRHGYVERDQQMSYDSKPRRRFFPGVRPGKHVIYLDPDHHVKKRVTVTLAPGEHRELRILLDKGTFLSGRIVGSGGGPRKAHVRFYWLDDGEEEYRSGMAGEDGRFELRGIPKGTGTFFAWPDGGGEGEWKNVATGRDLGNLVVRPAARVVGRLVGVESGTRMNGGIVYASGGCQTTWFSLDAGGRFEFTDIAVGKEFAAFIGVRGRAAFVARGLKVTPGRTIDLGDVRMPKPITLSGTVVHTSGKPVPFARVRVAQSWYEAWARTDGSGKFELKEMPPGPSLLVVEAGETPIAYAPVVVVENGDPVVITARSPGTIVATIVDAKGAPARGLWFNLFQKQPDGTRDWNRRRTAQTDMRGVIRIEAIPGRWFLDIHNNEDGRLTTDCPPIEVTEGNQTRITLTLE